MNIDANGEKESPDDEKGIKDRVLGERQSTVHFSKLNGDPANQMEKHGDTSDIQGSGTLQVQQQQQQTTQGTLVGWERFLHVRSIRVLLVEFDDCTRHVVTALLRNCNYEVLDAANGLQAWKILEDLTNHIDIVLTEVVMPFLSGVGLLHKIMSHNSRKNIPVIMMSSHDSMGLVFKCLSKGAVDFLVKPIRKNELKNLWQHVWRRCHSSSGSGSESGTQTQKSVKSRGRERSSNSSSDGGENDGSNGLDTGDGSDNGSGTQSSWTKQAVEADSSQAVSPMNRVAECPDSTCAQVIRSNAENSENEKMKASMAGEGSGQKQPDTTAKCNKNLETIAQRRVEFRSEDHVGRQLIRTAKESDSTTEVTNRINTKHNANDDCIEPSLELSLKRPRGVTDTDRTIQEDRYVLRRSEQSAFSRYNTSTNFFKAPNGGTGSSSIVDNSVAAAKRDSAGMQVYSADHILHQCLNGISNTIDMGLATNKFPKDKSEATSAVNGLNPSAFRLVKNEIAYNQQPVKRLPNGIQTTDPCPILASDHELRVQHPHQRDHHKSHRHLHIDQPFSNHDGSSLKKLDLNASHCGSTNVGGQMDGDRRNYSLNKSASGSNHGSNGPNGSSPAGNTAGNNAESDVGQDGKSGNGDASGSGSASASATRAAETKLAQREAALIKFRQKRKERCFKKKVRYQNRKKLAEQRPRVRGKFVKQTGTDSSNGTGD